MDGTSRDLVLSQPALGQDVQLGMLYDVRSSQFFAGVSLWDDDVVNAKQNLDTEKVQDAEFYVSYSLEEARRNVSLDVEGCLGLDLKTFSATGSAKYLNNMRSCTHEARVDVSCTVVRRTRRIPQEVLASVKYEKYLDDLQYTHFVAEVVEGGSATLSFVQSCSSAEEVKRVTGMLKIGIVTNLVRGSAKVERSMKDESEFENVRISYSGAMAENVSNLEDARRVAREMPTKLAKQLNTLRYKLLPLKVLDSKADRLIRSLDAGLVKKTADVLSAGITTGLQLRDLAEEEVFQKQFPRIQRQVLNFQDAFSAAEIEFTEDVRRLLPDLRDGATDESEKTIQLRKVVALFQWRTKISEKFVSIKYKEASVLCKTVETLLKSGYVNYLGKTLPLSLSDNTPRLLLSLGGPLIGPARHPLQARIEHGPSRNNINAGAHAAGNQDDDDTDNDDSGDEEEQWLKHQQTVHRSYDALRQLRSRMGADTPLALGVASIDKAYQPGKSKKSKTSVGDVLLYHQGKLLVIPEVPPAAPAAPKLTADGQNIIVTLIQEHRAIPTTGFIIKYCRQLNNNEGSPTEVKCAASETKVVLRPLSDDCNYEVVLSIQTILGPSAWSTPTIGYTEERASRLQERYRQYFPRRMHRMYLPR
ncbi:hypothetical protein TWF696_000669 [Orbilia brochopaga]|uniref:Fibronectin type-III domain-containing protein n=1 Tax=Orbilia brochopaga TaxID=3140254 RepID=A0AAV9VCC5_9PEZI